MNNAGLYGDSLKRHCLEQFRLVDRQAADFEKDFPLTLVEDP